jgi:hypothetical protein
MARVKNEQLRSVPIGDGCERHTGRERLDGLGRAYAGEARRDWVTACVSL